MLLLLLGSSWHGMAWHGSLVRLAGAKCDGVTRLVGVVTGWRGHKVFLFGVLLHEVFALLL